MSKRHDQPALDVGAELHGFAVRKVTALAGLRSTAYEIEHASTGARLIHVLNDDTENLFSVTFRTPPPDDTGVPHILEHTVLGGSKKFPVKSPFFEMYKMSMATFINAMTGADKTMYPVASNVERDIFNLAEVYFDAVFHAGLSRRMFMQEAHHPSFEKKGDVTSSLVENGIVYNEMKGAFSSPDAVVGRRTMRSLFPDSPYGNESGGDPEHIPELTYEALKGFYARLYCPSNAFFFIYGDVPTAKWLAFLAERLEGFAREDVGISIPRQARWDAPRSMSESYPVGPDEDTSEKTYVTMSWLTGDGTDAREVLAFTVLDLALLGNQAAPLRKAIIDSRLGHDLTHSGFSGGMLESMFSVGVKGSEPDRREAFEELVVATLTTLADGGIPREKIDAAFQQLSYRYLEIQSLFPLHVMMRVLGSWTHGADPLAFLRAGELIADLRREYDGDGAIFSRLIRERLLDNSHRLTAVFAPDRDFQARKDAELAQLMAEKKSAMSEEELQAVATEAAELERLQSTPNSPEALATLPQLEVSDLPRTPRRIPTTVTSELADRVELLRNDVFANGVSYLYLDFDLDGLPEGLLPYLEIYGDCVRKMGAAGQDYVKIAERVSAHTGGIGFHAACGTHLAEADRTLLRGRFTMKMLDAKAGDALAVLHDIVFGVDPRDRERLREVALQRRAYLRSFLAHRGGMIALYHAARGLNPVCRASELIYGLPQLRLSADVADQFDERCEEAAGKVEAVRGFMLGARRITASFTGSDGVHEKVRDTLAAWAKEMPADGAERTALAPSRASGSNDFEPPEAAPRDGLAAPMEIAHCASAFPAPHYSHPDAALLAVGGRLLMFDYVLEEIRIKGGSYGASCYHDPSSCTWRFSSYLDPHVRRTLDVFRGARDFVAAREWSKAEVDRAIIGTAKEAERPIRPESATGAALARHVAGETDDVRERRHEAMLRATPAEVKRALLDLLEAGLAGAGAGVCVVSSRERLEKASAEMPDAPLAIEDVFED